MKQTIALLLFNFWTAHARFNLSTLYIQASFNHHKYTADLFHWKITVWKKVRTEKNVISVQDIPNGCEQLIAAYMSRTAHTSHTY